MTYEEQKRAAKISSVHMDHKTSYSCVPREKNLLLAGAMENLVLQYTEVQRLGILYWQSAATSL